jgi:hypothetical protein
MKLEFDLKNIDIVDIEGDNIIVHFPNRIKLVFKKKIYDYFLKQGGYNNEDDYYYNRGLIQYVKLFLLSNS